MMGKKKTTSHAHFKQHTCEGNDLLLSFYSEILGIYCKIESTLCNSPVYTTDTFGIPAKCCIVFQFLSRVHIWNLPFQHPGLWVWHRERVSPNVHKALEFGPQNHKARKGGIARQRRSPPSLLPSPPLFLPHSPWDWAEVDLSGRPWCFLAILAW